jgi:hypothetical protein
MPFRAVMLTICAASVLAISASAMVVPPKGPNPTKWPGPCPFGQSLRTVCTTEQHPPGPPVKVCKQRCFPL